MTSFFHHVYFSWVKLQWNTKISLLCYLQVLLKGGSGDPHIFLHISSGLPGSALTLSVVGWGVCGGGFPSNMWSQQIRNELKLGCVNTVYVDLKGQILFLGHI